MAYAPGEEAKAKYIADEYSLFRLRNDITTPIFLYEARDLQFGTKACWEYGIYGRTSDNQVDLLPAYWSYMDPLRGATAAGIAGGN